MKDEEIINLYWNKSENAIFETEKKYRKYCEYIAYNILQDKEDTKECINDAFLNVWNAIPPQKPKILKAFLGKITRNLAINKYEKKKAKKRGWTIEAVLEELEECISDNHRIEEKIEYEELIKNINVFLETLSKDKRKIFIERYWYLNSIKVISKNNKLTESNTKTTLSRIRNQLKKFLDERGVEIWKVVWYC